ncbi:hypothetical protein S2M10_07020 [Sphingomonas sp. S2M10]|uniref:hypothetical protein n=1 Tax=Sphingomonas sp. S2M10 TaxID=2705010 RepID=UPI0014563753|nr:hypothetical protein [Sphingomonas sp. S2M10]NLS25732.1 hypothetical protein [Sphingomonas sp. S2M10]
MELPTNEELLSTFQSFLDRHSMAPTRFGALATGEPQLIASIKKGRSPRLALLHRVKAFMDAKDAELAAEAGDHAEADNSQVQHASCGSETIISDSDEREVA